MLINWSWFSAYENPKESTVNDFLAFMDNISDKKEANQLLDFAIKITNEVI